MAFKRVISFMITLVMLLGISVPALATEGEAAVSFDDYVMSHQEEFADSSSLMTNINTFSLRRSASESVEMETTSSPRYSLLMLDVSGSMYGTPMTKMKQAAIRFCEQVLAADTTDNYIGIVSFTSSARSICSFTNDIEELKEKINRLSASGGTSQYAPLNLAKQLLGLDIPSNAIKNIVLLSDGLPESGQSSYTGPYSSSMYYGYRYANATYTLAQEMHEDYKIYTLGFFHSLSSNYLSFARQYMSDLSNAGYYEVENPEDLEFTLGDIATDIVSGEFSFRFASSINEEADVVGKCFYSDDYFKDSSYGYNSHLATVSLCLALSTFTRINDWNSTDPNDRAAHWPDRMNNAKDLLTGGGVTEGNGLGFDEFWYNDAWLEDPKTSTIGMIAANKPLGDYTLIAVALRGGGYYNEWGGNFEIGALGDHENWTNAKNHVIEQLQQYIKKFDIKGDLKLWIVGYSRSGAIANLTAAELNNHGTELFAGCTLEQKNIYAYTFATPQGTVTGKVDAQGAHKNINNIINSNDIVPRVAMSGYNFRRYGVDHVIYNPADYQSGDSVKAMKQQLKRIFQWAGKTGKDEEVNKFYDIIPDYTRTIVLDDLSKVGAVLPGGKSLLNFTVTDNKHFSNGEMQADFLQTIVETIGERSVYQSKLQTAISQVLGQFLGVHNESNEVIANGLVTALSAAKLNVQKYLDIFDPDASAKKKAEARTKLISEVWGAISPTMTSSGLAVTRDSFEKLVNVLLDAYEKNPTTFLALMDNLLGVLNDKPEILNKLNQANIDVWWFIKANEIVNMADFGGKFNGCFGSAHMGDIYLAFMMAEDDYYTSTPTWCDGVPSMRIIRINCPVDVTITDDDGNVVAYVKDHKDIYSLPNIGCTVTVDGEIQIRVSGNETFHVQIDATDDGTVFYSVSEYNYDIGKEVRLVHYFNVNVEKGDVLQGMIEKIDEQEYDQASSGSTSAYTLNNPSGVPLVPVEISGAENISYHQVSISSMNADYGTVFGGGKYIAGSFAMARAFPVNGSAFLGWYEDGELVSTESEYRFSVQKDITLEGKFSEVSLYNVRFQTVGNGEIENVDLKLSAGTELMLSANDVNGNFVEWYSTAGNIAAPKSPSTTIVVPASDITVTASFASIYNLFITQQPVDQDVVAGQQATFSINAIGESVTYQWYINRNKWSGWTKIDGAIGASYTTSVVDIDCDGYKYYCAVADQYGNTVLSNEAVLHVTPALVVPETGDSFTFMFWLAMSMLSMLGILLIHKKAYSK